MPHIHGKGSRLVDKLRKEYRKEVRCAGREQRNFDCPNCLMSFKTEDEYKVHYKEKHARKEQQHGMSKVWKGSFREFV
jgi:hypothetical protein